MPSKKPHLAALIVCLTLTSCSNSPPPSSVLLPPQQTVLPAELAVRCPPPALPDDNSADAAVVALKTVYDQYGVCAGRLANIIQCVQGGSCGN
ncbi:Uncharacterised protein [Serratia marcescens]|nr:Uncharacterised protein [Serratia marcescens]CVB48687.1 Uncharacterised protein [Serratia marcescens]CVB58939.1 Uncharacterised protein [Serratia marcescens]CVB60606.1 Uncharacterised protein [Serratia marcescens]CVB82404.1 Uncharacterised protein [Serratia marcescens]